MTGKHYKQVLIQASQPRASTIVVSSAKEGFLE